LSFNNLSGHILLGNQLQTLDNKSINIGNDGLRGPLIRSCPEDETSSEGHERIEYKINDQPEACYGVVVEFLGVCSNLHFMKSSTKYTTCNNYGKERQIRSKEHSAVATFEHEKISFFVFFFCVDIPSNIHITSPESIVTCPFGKAIVFSCVHGF
jgi:hypothetical protein